MQVQGTFYGESRLHQFPLMDLNGLPSGALQNMTANGQVLQLSADRDSDWLLWGYSAMRGISASGGLPALLAPINLQVVRQDTRELQAAQTDNAINFGTPLEHIAGKAGNPFYFSYPRVVPDGTRLIPSVAQFTGVTPTGRSPLYVTAHTQLIKKNSAPGIIGSRYEQELTYRGEWVPYTALLDFSTTPLAVNQSKNVILPINTTQYMFIDTLTARETFMDAGSVVSFGPTSALNPLQAEHELLVSFKDTSNQAPFNLPSAAPLWTMFGNVAARAYHPSTCFVVRPRGSLDITVTNGPTAAFQGKLWLTFAGCLVDKPSKEILERLNA